MEQEATPIKVLLADDHALIRTGMKNLLEGNKRFLVVGEAANGEEAVEKTRDLAPDVVIIDISMPKLSGHAQRVLLCIPPHCRTTKILLPYRRQ